MVEITKKVKKVKKKKKKKKEEEKKGKGEYDAILEAKRLMGEDIPEWKKRQIQYLIGIDVIREVESEESVSKTKLESKIKKLRKEGEKELGELPQEKREKFEESFEKVYDHPEVYSDLKSHVIEKYLPGLKEEIKKKFS